MSFNSLQTGKAFRTSCDIQDANKALRVSIPFKRERLSEQEVRHIDNIITISFNSLQTGKAFRTKSVATSALRRINKVSIPFKRERLSEHRMDMFIHLSSGFKFQFPSNGKGFPNEYVKEKKGDIDMSFNSLQTGKAFRTL